MGCRYGEVFYQPARGIFFLRAYGQRRTGFIRVDADVKLLQAVGNPAAQRLDEGRLAVQQGKKCFRPASSGYPSRARTSAAENNVPQERHSAFGLIFSGPAQPAAPGKRHQEHAV